MNREYIKDWVWEGREIMPGDQTYIFAKQARKERVYMTQGLDFIVSDSPIALSILYGNKYDKYERNNATCTQMLKQHHEFCKDHGYKVDHFFLVRKKAYNQAGRKENEEQAGEIDKECFDLLNTLGINYRTVECDEFIEDTIVKMVLENE